jgi:hypothetical protein
MNTIDDRFDTTIYAVEANSFEKQILWEKFNERVEWVQGNGIGKDIGNGTFVSLLWDTINKKTVLFYEATSAVVDHDKVKAFIKEQCNVPTCDAQNFHRCVSAIEKLQEEKKRPFIKLNGHELQSGVSRQSHAEKLIEQLPVEHNGRNCWLLNYGVGAEARNRRGTRKLEFDQETQSAEVEQSPSGMFMQQV